MLHDLPYRASKKPRIAPADAPRYVHRCIVEYIDGPQDLERIRQIYRGASGPLAICDVLRFDKPDATPRIVGSYVRRMTPDEVLGASEGVL